MLLFYKFVTMHYHIATLQISMMILSVSIWYVEVLPDSAGIKMFLSNSSVLKIAIFNGL